MNNNLIIAGDLFPTPVNVDYFRKGDIEHLFGKKICDIFGSSFFSICNLEGVLTDSQSFIEKASGPCIKAPKDSINAYKLLGIKCVATANNHIMDYRANGYHDTCEVLNQSGIVYIGSGENVALIRKYISVEINGHRICIYNVAETMYNVPTDSYPGANLYDEYLVCREIEALKKIFSFLVVIYHGGVEWFTYPTPEIRKRFHRMAESGADIIVSQHTHCLGCEEFYKDSYLLYGQGNFLFTRHNKHRGGGVLLDINFEKSMPTISLHHYIHTDIGVIYDDNQDLTLFKERSSHINDSAFVERQLIDYVLTLYPRLSSVFQSHTLLDTIIEHIIPSKYYWTYRSRFRTKLPNSAQILFLQYILESEQQSETLSYILKGLLKRNS